MRTVIANGAIVVWAVVLIYSPAFAWAATRRASPAVFAIGGLVSLIAMSVIGYIAGELGVGALNAMRCLVVVLGLVLLFAVYRLVLSFVRRTRIARDIRIEWLAVPLSAFVGFWALSPALVALHREGLTFGLASLGNSDLPNYVLAAQNLASAGFRDTHHIANINVGHSIPTGTPIGPIALIVFISAATGFSMLQVAMAAMAVAVSALGVGLWALGRAIWPRAQVSVAVSVIVSALAGLAVYNYGQYFLGAELGSAAIAVTAAGVIAIGRSPSAEAIGCVVCGAAFGIYGYSPLGIPVLLVVPFAAVGAALVFGNRGLRAIARPVLVTIAAEVVALAITSLALGDAIALARLQSNDQAGWSLPVVSATSATVWPQKIGHAQSTLFVAGTWGAFVAVVAAAFVVAWRRGERTALYTAGLIFAAAVVIVFAFAHLYGADRYQTWKIESFLLPIAMISALPSFGVSISLVRPLVGRAALVLAIGVVLIGPWSLWRTSLGTPQNPALITDRTLAELNRSPLMSKIAVINVRLPYPVTSMSAGAVLNKTVVVFTQASYFPNMTALDTCTLTTRTLLTPGETAYTDLGGGYVLLARPSACAYKK